MTTLLPETKKQKTRMETKNKDEKDALIVVRNWVESQLKPHEDFHESLFDVLANHLFIWTDDLNGFCYGPPYLGVFYNVKKIWHQHFVIKDCMQQIQLFPAFNQDSVSEASGQVDIDTDHMFKDEMTHHELKHILVVLYDLFPEQHGASNEYDNVKANTRNLFFETQLDITSEYKRLETPQLMFNGVKGQYGWNNFPFPFSVATIMNEDSPKLLLLIEHFVDPDDNSHQKYFEVSNLEFLMFTRDEQMSGQCAKRLCLGQAVFKGIIKNQSLAYFIGKVYLYLTRLGIDEERLRFRQNLSNMDHYAEDYWMAEIKSSLGWIECVLIADRSVSDLDKIGVSLKARKKLAQPKEVEKVVVKPIKKELGPAFGNDRIKVFEALKTMNEKDAMEMKAALESKEEVEFEVCTLEKTVTIKRNMVSISKETKKVHHRTFKYAVIESSFVMGRIIYCLFEHSFYTRPSTAGKQEICVFLFSPLVAPKQCYIFSLVQDQQSKKVVQRIAESLHAVGISHEHSTWVNTYARADECGTPFSITVVSTSSVTIRERDTQDQIYVSMEEVAAVVQELCEGRSTWADVWKKYPAAGSIQLPKMTEH